jgi:hypothetical protein
LKGNSPELRIRVIAKPYGKLDIGTRSKNVLF